MIWNIIGWIVIGGLAGAIAKLIMPGKDPGGMIVTIIIGIVGAFLGGWLGGLLFSGGNQVSGGNAWSWTSLLYGIVGALILLGIYRLVAPRLGAGSRRT